MHKKCMIASVGLHSLLVIILFVGPAFLAPNEPKMPDMPVLDFVPFETVDALMSGGGNPNAQPPPATPNARPQPVAATPPPPPERKPEPEPVKPPPEVRPEPAPEKIQEAALEPSSKPQPKKKPVVNLKPIVRKTESGESKAAKEARERAEREYAESRKKFASAVGSAAKGLPNSISSSTTVEFHGPGGGGIPYANFLQAVKSAYTHAWALPEGITDDDATVATTVTIARDGSVISAKISRRSGNSAVDASVRATLDRVTYAAPLPRDAKEDQRTVTINFNVRAKKLMG